MGRLPLKSLLAYAAMLAATIGAFFLVRDAGSGLSAPARETSAPAAIAPPSDALLHVLLALVVVIAVARSLGWLFKRIHQPPVIGEVIAGILLGPSVLGRLLPSASAYLLPPAVAPYLGVIAQVGVILYMFLVGLHLDTSVLRARTQASIAVSHASITAPFLLGSGLALWLYPRYSSSDVPFTVFALFMGASMSVTAFPVLARILTDRRMQQTRLGTIALACAAVDDATAWCLLAFVVAVVQSQPGRVLFTVGLTAAFIAFVVIVIRPLAKRLVERHAREGALSQRTLSIVCVALLLCALATERIGIHALFGAFLLGAVVPHDSALAKDLAHKLEDLVLVLLLPAFFAFTGMRTQIGLVSGGSAWLACAAIIAVASAGKFGGSAVAARLTGLDWRESMGLGILMNTRGLMELVILNVGYELGVLSPTLFAMFVLMALVTTIATTPVLKLLRVETAPAAEIDAAPARV